jgi:fatty acid desaturase
MSNRVENIVDRGARLRRRAGVVWLIIAIAGAGVLIWTGEPRWWRLALAVPYFLAAIGFLQARERT